MKLTTDSSLTSAHLHVGSSSLLSRTCSPFANSGVIYFCVLDTTTRFDRALWDPRAWWCADMFLTTPNFIRCFQYLSPSELIMKYYYCFFVLLFCLNSQSFVLTTTERICMFLIIKAKIFENVIVIRQKCSLHDKELTCQACSQRGIRRCTRSTPRLTKVC